MATVVAAELLDGTIRGRHQLLGVVASNLIVSIPYFATHRDTVRARWRVIFVSLTVIILLAALGGLAAAIVLGLPVDLSWFNKAATP